MSISMMYLLYFIIVCVQSIAWVASSPTNGAGCEYEGRWVEHMTVVWEDPKCECTQLICLGYQVELVRKDKPCCKVNHVIYGNEETIRTGTCEETICKSGKEVSLPKCPKDYVPITYNDCVGCYNVSVDVMNHMDAQQYCRGLAGGKLVEITTEGEEKALEWHLLENYYKMGVTSYWTGGSALASEFPIPPTPPMPGPYMNRFYWQSLFGIPIEAIHNDFCHKQPSPNSEMTALQLSYYDRGEFCWCNENPEKKKLAICEICTMEKSYQTNCIYKEKIYANGDVMADITEAPGPCFELVCNNGKTIKKEKPCEPELTDPDQPPPPPTAQV